MVQAWVALKECSNSIESFTYCNCYLFVTDTKHGLSASVDYLQHSLLEPSYTLAIEKKKKISIASVQQ